MTNDSRLSESREWTASTVGQAEAEAGTATTRRALTAQRVRQAAVAAWNALSSAWGRGFVNSADAGAARTTLGLGTAATRDVGTGSGNVMGVGAFGLGSLQAPSAGMFPPPVSGIYQSAAVPSRTILVLPRADSRASYLEVDNGGGKFSLRGEHYNPDSRETFSGIVEFFHTGNILTTTGQSTEYPMTQKATTDAINARGFADASGILTVTSGALSNDMSGFLSQTTKATMRSNLGVPQLNASPTQQGGLKARLSGTTLYLSNNGTNP